MTTTATSAAIVTVTDSHSNSHSNSQNVCYTTKAIMTAAAMTATAKAIVTAAATVQRERHSDWPALAETVTMTVPVIARSTTTKL